MGARTIGTVAGAVIGGVIGYFSFQPQLAFYGASLGASLGAGEGEGRPPLLPQFACPPGMGRLLAPVLGVPFRLGARDPAHGGIDCLGFILWALREGLGIELQENGRGDIEPTDALTCVWRQQPGRVSHSWVHQLQPWDILLWFDPQANAALRGEGPPTTWVHAALAVNHDTLVSATLSDGVAFHRAKQIAHTFGPTVLWLHRPVGIGHWQPAQEAPAPAAVVSAAKSWLHI